jgi:hypothetical protein
MFQLSQSAVSDLDSNLLTIWMTRYLPDLGLIPTALRVHFEDRLSVVISPDARRTTQQKILEYLVTDCAFAGIQAQGLMLEADQPLPIKEAKELGLKVADVYRLMLDYYVEDFVFTPVLQSLYTIDSENGKQTAAQAILPAFHRLMEAVEPMLYKLQEIHYNSENQRAIGFLTTQLHLTRQRVLDHLTAYERIWLLPYLQLTEELVCMPWRRICQAAQNSLVKPQTSLVVQTMLPQANEIAKTVYQKAIRTFPNHISRQGRIQSHSVERSSVRDLNMFQSYIWLAVLEGKLEVIENELLPLCLLVFPCANVQWQFVRQGIAWLMEEIQTQLDPAYQTHFQNCYAEPIKQLFAQAGSHRLDVSDVRSRLSLA